MKIFINTSPAYELKLIRGVGNAIADKIISERKRKHFDDKEDLYKRVPKFPRKDMEHINLIVP
jgi:predicted nucleic acid-binding OB-fold protein